MTDITFHDKLKKGVELMRYQNHPMIFGEKHKGVIKS